MNNRHIITIARQHIEQVWAIEQQAHITPWSKSMIEDIEYTNSERSSKYHFALWQDEELLGYVYSQNIMGEVTLLTIAVDPAHQGKGAGKQLVKHLIEHSRSHQAQSIWLEVRASNHKAYHLYESLGFNEIDRRMDYYPTKDNKKEDAIVMCLESVYLPYCSR